MVSVVVPIFNEEENLPELRRRLAATLEKIGDDWEILFVDDGSRDRSLQIIRGFHSEDSRLKLLSLSRNFGHQPAITAGIHHARGDCVALIDGDLQDPPEILPEFLAKWRQGFQVVYAVRRKRKEWFGKRLAYWAFYRMLNQISDIDIPLDSGDFCLMDRTAVDLLNAMPERQRFVRGLRTWIGLKQTGIEYDRPARAGGEPQYTLAKLTRLAMDGLVSFSSAPLRAATYFGFLTSAIAMLLAVYYFITFFLFHKQAGSGFTTVVLCVLFLGGVQLICVGILGEYIGRIYEEIKQRPVYIVRERLGCEMATDKGGVASR